ncbi:MAG TPA: hypothetical protein VF591_17465 [Pyrinomonadaceae bacterium]|jgi:hypothetical protein
MPTKTTSKKAASKKAAGTRVATQIRLRASAVVVKPLDQPPTFVKPKRIHPRRLLPLVREGDEREFHSLTPQTLFHTPDTFFGARAAFGPLAAADELKIVTNTELTEPGKQQTASNVGEPSVAINDNVVFYTGNWYAAISTDAGRTFKFIAPGADFKDPKNGSTFCCDQIVHYIGKIDTFVWLLQYGPDTGDNVQRLAFAKTADAAKNKWRVFDITTASLKVPGAFLDFPDLAVGANSLYLTTNIFGPGQQFGSAVVRIPFAGIESGKVTATPFVSKSFQSFRVAQNCGTTAYFAAHQDTSTLAVFSWKEGQNAPVQKSVAVARWLGGNSGYISRTPDGRRWLDRCDPRLSGATLAKDELWFAWTVDRNSNHRPRPFIQIAKIKASDLTLLENINVFDNDNATAYGALSTNEDGEVGISYMVGGKTLAPSHVVGILTGARKDVIVSKGDRGPSDPDTGRGEWGDYLAVRRVYPNQRLFAATGYTMKGPGDGSDRDSTPRFVVFGRAAAVGLTPGGGIGGVGGGEVVIDTVITDPGGPDIVAPTPAEVGAPFKDVNKLPQVSAAVAAQIKAAAVAEGKLPSPFEEEFVPLAFVIESPLLATKPGVERWPVKTGTDENVALVGKNIIGGHSLGAGVVGATIEELTKLGRPPGMRPANKNFDHQFHGRRLGVVEQTVWRIDAEIIALKQEKDGDYHLVLRGASGEMMVAESTTPTKKFVGDSPWLENMKAVRKAIDDRLVKPLTPAAFVQFDGVLVPRESLPETLQPLAAPAPSGLNSFVTPEDDDGALRPTFQTKVKPTPVRLTGVGFFDRVHGSTGESKFNGIELHPVLKVEWL